jgi:hypothetical protein
MPVITIGENIGDDFAGISDTELMMGDPTTNVHTAETYEIAKFNSSGHRDVLIVVDFTAFRTSISNASITVNSVSLNMFPTAFTGTEVIGIFRSLRAAVATQATWNIYSTGNNWASGGGRGNGTDRVATPLGAFSSLVGGYAGAALTAADVQTIINAGGALVLTLERTDGADDGTFSTWRAADNSVTNERPFIQLDYALGSTPNIRAISSYYRMLARA